ncbi:SCO family protein [Hydrogenophaga taeniospiralis]|uniref:SCO family protein n=1 Tax=Hydrogenophaga taeniospiralis TaxID=65656 RepID=UPI001CF99EAB|nr:SCO family protein [Hydrogenophaga taeniospiralis]MCB4363812.1 SCO family protein [Hydrogenophaga taeniospiralis]
MPRFPVSRAGAPADPRRRAATLWLGGLALGTGGLLAGCDQTPLGAPAPVFKGIDITGAAYGRQFALTDFNGQPRTLADYRGQVVMLYFGFVQCPDVCPTALTRAAAVKQQLGADAAQLQVIFVTVDPERDTPELLRDYMAAFDPSFMALTGSPAQIKAVADEFRVYYKKVPTGSTYTMDHTALSYLFDREGRIRVVLRHEQTADDYTADIRQLLAQTPA